MKKNSKEKQLRQTIKEQESRIENLLKKVRETRVCAAECLIRVRELEKELWKT